MVEETQEEGNLFLACHNPKENNGDIWFVDSGCSNHMKGQRNRFDHIDESVKKPMRLGDDKTVQVEGQGNIVIEAKSSNKTMMDGVYYIPGLAHNLLSVGQMMENGYSVLFEDSMCIIRRKLSNMLVAEIPMTKNRMFPFDVSYLNEFSLAANVSANDDSHLWHLRYGHLHFNGLKLLSQRKMAFGLPSIMYADDVFEGCIYGKQHWLPFPVDKAWRVKQPLEIVHTDICGPTRTLSLNKSRYFLLFTDDYTRMSWVYFCSYKLEAFEKILEFKVFTEKESGYHLKVL